MGQSPPCDPPQLTERQLDALCRRVRDAVDLMADDQILRLADTLHDALRDRRRMRVRVHHRVEARLGLI